MFAFSSKINNLINLINLMSVRLWCGLFQELRDVIFGSVACLRTHRGQTTKARAERSKKLRFILSDSLVKECERHKGLLSPFVVQFETAVFNPGCGCQQLKRQDIFQRLQFLAT